MECQFCKKTFSKKSNLIIHQKKTKYCLKLQGKESEIMFNCEYCEKNFVVESSYNRHLKTHENNTELVKCHKKLENLQSKNRELESIIQSLKEQLDKQNQRLENIAVKAVSKPTTINNNVMNNFKLSAQPLTAKFLEVHAKNNLRIEHFTHYNGIEGFARFALEHPLKNNVICTDHARKIIKWKLGNTIIKDPGGDKLWKKLCESQVKQTFHILDRINETIQQRTDIDSEEKAMRYRNVIKLKGDFKKGIDGNDSDSKRIFINIIINDTVPSQEVGQDDNILDLGLVLNNSDFHTDSEFEVEDDE